MARVSRICAGRMRQLTLGACSGMQPMPVLLKPPGRHLPTGFAQLCAPGSIAAASTKAAKAVRKRKQKSRFKYVRLPPHLIRQREGDFPVQVRPVGRQLEIRDLQDAAFDAEAAAGYGRAPKPKPHRVREAVLGQPSRLSSQSHHSLETSVELKRLKEQRVQASQIPHLDPERDLRQEDAIELATGRARAAARRNYKFMPNPFSEKPGPLGTSAAAQSKYYERYFDGRRSAEEQQRGTFRGGGDAEELKDPGSPKLRRQRISPKQFWIKPDHVTPDPSNVPFMNSRELKFAMVNEAHLVRKWRNEQPEGRSAGMPPNSLELWMSFGYRAAQLAKGVGAAGTDPADSTAPQESSGRQQQCSLSTALRFLQCLASVQAGPYSAMQQLSWRAVQDCRDLRPQQCFFLLQALGRLRLKHPKSSVLLERLSLTWRTLPAKQFVKAANAVAKLDLAGGMWARPLKAALVTALPQIGGKHLALLKGIAVMELLDAPEALKSYLEQCEQLRTHFWYSRHLQLVELHVHLLHPHVWQDLEEHTRLFLQEVRTAAERSCDRDSTAARTARSTARRTDEAAGSDTEEDEEDSDDEDHGQWGFDRRSFSSALHADVSRVLSKILEVEHHNQLPAGPLMLDMCHLSTMTVVEAAERWQFYLRSPQITAMARRRHELLRAMGFRVVHVPFHRWSRLNDDEEKAAFLRTLLPSDVFRQEQAAADVSPSAKGAGGTKASSAAKGAGSVEPEVGKAAKTAARRQQAPSQTGSSTASTSG